MTKIVIISRNQKITPNLVNKKINVYNGKNFHELTILPNMVNYKVGEFSLTKTKIVHKKKFK
jgi:small subunit ribosomal protein S19|uniref:Ribosomal protein S19 n=1 Tax=Entomoneis sp. TaxID=186043 RepID=A0A3G1PWA8_9STRA|nr:ribosomal protein S19 [Entomoneis sp.]